MSEALFVIWLLGFLLLSFVLMLSHTSPDPDDHWPPASIVLAALWPALALLAAIAPILEPMLDDLIKRLDKIIERTKR